jgi:hypothetical protein
LPLNTHAAQRVADNVKRVQDHLGVPMALENISYYAAPGLGTNEGAALLAIEQDFIGEVLTRADCKLLLDVNNVYVNAVNHGFDAARFLDGLPLDRVVQLHIAGGERRPRLDNLIIDTHGADVNAQVQALMAQVIERVGPLPVLYERDHSIPPLPELLRQVDELDEVYQAALARHRHRQGLSDAPAPERLGARATHVAPREMGTTDGFQHGLTRYILDEEDPGPTLATTGVDYFRAQGLGATDSEVLTQIGAARLNVYRQLPRNGMKGCVQEFLPRTIARLDAIDEGATISFAREFSAWLAGPGPRSRYLRDLPREFVTWAAPRWLETPEIPNYLADLARHELVDFAVAAAPRDPPRSPVEASFSLEGHLRFAESAQLVHYQHAVHELPSDEDDRSAPRAEPTHLLVYRDKRYKPRYLRLSALASEVVERLQNRGCCVREALVEGAQAAGEALDNEVLGRLSALLADLSERGIVEPR